MAKQFGGFTPEQLGKIDPAMAGMQADEQVKYMAANPGVSSRVGNMAQQAKKRISMANGGVVKKQGYALGGVAATVAPADNTPNLGQPMTYDPITGLPNNDAKDSLGMPMIGDPKLPNPDDPIYIDDPVKLPNPDVPVYDPSKGLPDLAKLEITPEEYTAIYDKAYEGFTNYKPEDITFGKTEAEKLVSNDKVMEDPSNYTLETVKRGSGNYWNIVYPDGTKIDTGHQDKAQAQNRANTVVAGAKAIKEAPQFASYKEAQTQYNKNLDAYKSYYGAKGSTGSVTSYEDAKAALSSAQALKSQYDVQLAGMAADDPQRKVIEGLVQEQAVVVTAAKNNYNTAEANYKRQNVQTAAEAQQEIQADPMANIVTGKAAVIDPTDVDKGKMATGVGDAGGADIALTDQAVGAGDISKATEFGADTFTAKEAAEEVQKVMNTLSAATGKPSIEALAEAATMDPQQLAQLGLTVAQIENAQRVQAPDRLVATEDQLVSGPTVDFERAKAETNFTAATGVPSTEATVQGQLTSLMEDFEGGNPPAWAAGAMRAATATMAARGLAASSMAGQAIIQATMESALPIAMQDAQTVASFEAQNLSNRQQAAMFNAEQRAKFLGMEFDQAFQVRVQRAGRIADVANMNFSAEQQIALENARMAQTVDITNLTAKNAKVMADAAAMSQLDLTNLSNLQQANVQKATAFLQFDMRSLDNQQQVAMFKAQSVAGALLSDTSAINAQKQFNSSSNNQVDMFFSNLQTQIDTFNRSQTDAMAQFNTGETNAIAQFNTAQSNARDQFNTQNALVIEQSNAVWDQAVVTQETAAQNEMNRVAAMAANEQAAASYAATMQAERDTASYAHLASESKLEKEHEITVEIIRAEAATASAEGAAAGTLMAAVVPAVIAALPKLG